MKILPRLCSLAIAISLSFSGVAAENGAPVDRSGPVPWIDLSAQSDRQVIVDREPGTYLGHPTTLLLPDGQTILCVYPKGHGRGAIIYKRSYDGGLTWSERLDVPDNWATSLETPTLHRVIDKAGTARIIMWSGLYPARLAVSEDEGETWSPLKPVGDWGGIVVMSSVVELKTPGSYLALFHDDGRFLDATARTTDPRTMTLLKSFSDDGGLTWTEPHSILARQDVHLCEPGAIRSPDGEEIAVLLRENRRVKNSFVIFSRDEGRTWTAPAELSSSLTGDRHVAKYAPDGRLVISFRDTAHSGSTRGDWIAWVGNYEDLHKDGQADFRMRLKENLKGQDCAYPGVEVLPDGTFVCTTYGHWTAGEMPYILSVRFHLDELDRMLDAKSE